METSFGTVLKEWRAQRRMSQLDLGLSSNVSARHISFLETGRAKPSRSMVLQLCETLAVPRSARNGFLNAAGFAPAYRSRSLTEADMAHVQAAVDWTLERHNPYPAMALDRHWTVVKANASAGFLLSGAGLREGDSLLAAMTDGETFSAVIENWTEVAQHMVVRLRTESAYLGGDEVLEEAAAKLSALLGNAPRSGHEQVLPAIIPARYRANGAVFSFFSTLAQFGTAEDIALAELKIELMFPADDLTHDTLMSLTPAPAD